MHALTVEKTHHIPEVLAQQFFSLQAQTTLHRFTDGFGYFVTPELIIAPTHVCHENLMNERFNIRHASIRPYSDETLFPDLAHFHLHNAKEDAHCLPVFQFVSNAETVTKIYFLYHPTINQFIRVANVANPESSAVMWQKFEVLGDVSLHPGVSGLPVFMAWCDLSRRPNEWFFRVKSILIRVENNSNEFYALNFWPEHCHVYSQIVDGLMMDRHRAYIKLYQEVYSNPQALKAAQNKVLFLEEKIEAKKRQRQQQPVPYLLTDISSHSTATAFKGIVPLSFCLMLPENHKKAFAKKKPAFVKDFLRKNLTLNKLKLAYSELLDGLADIKKIKIAAIDNWLSNEWLRIDVAGKGTKKSPWMFTLQCNTGVRAIRNDLLTSWCRTGSTKGKTPLSNCYAIVKAEAAVDLIAPASPNSPNGKLTPFVLSNLLRESQDDRQPKCFEST